MIKLKRFEKNPILSPTKNAWENLSVFNPAAIVDENKIKILYRAQGEDSISRLGYAESENGFDFKRSDNWVYQGGGHEFETLGVEDPRMVKINDIFYVVYTGVSEIKGAEINPNWPERIAKRIRVSLATTEDFKNFKDYDVIVPNTDAKNASLFPHLNNNEYWLLYRNPKNETYFTHSKNLIAMDEPHFVFKERAGYWDEVRTGIGCPPIETELGWLLFYHGVDKFNVYRLGVMLLERQNPQYILYRSPEPIFEPEKDFEKVGFVPNVVFTCGVVLFQNQFFIYYGAADETIGVATISQDELLTEIKANIGQFEKT